MVPPDACDSHAHLCGPASHYPYSGGRVYTPPDALMPAYRHMLDMLGVQRAVLVQPSVYGSDNRAMVDALSQEPARLRGVAVVESDVATAELERLHAAGVRGVRCNIVDVKEGRGQLPLAMLHALAQKVKPFGWHIELLLHVDAFPTLDVLLGDFPVDVVFGHFGYMPVRHGAASPAFQALLRLMRAGRAWTKLTGPYRISALPMPHADVTPFAQALVEAAPSRVVWGSDWPHVMVKGAMPNDGALCDLLQNWVPDIDARRRVLVDNPAELYDF